MAGNLFIDTNILVYANNSLSPFSTAARIKLNEAVTNYENLWVSRQVFREFAAIVSREMLAAGNLDFVKLGSVILQFERDFWLQKTPKWSPINGCCCSVKQNRRGNRYTTQTSLLLCWCMGLMPF